MVVQRKESLTAVTRGNCDQSCSLGRATPAAQSVPVLLVPHPHDHRIVHLAIRFVAFSHYLAVFQT